MTARLSKSFYDRFGDDVANELVEWFNSVEATYRENLLELNDLNFARFGAKLDGLGVAQQFAKVEDRFAKIDERFATIDERFAKVEERFDQVDARFAQIDVRFAQIDLRFAEVGGRFDRLEGLLREHLLTVAGRFDHFEARMLRWVLTFWVGTLLGLAALVWAMVRAR